MVPPHALVALLPVGSGSLLAMAPCVAPRHAVLAAAMFLHIRCRAGVARWSGAAALAGSSFSSCLLMSWAVGIGNSVADAIGSLFF